MSRVASVPEEQGSCLRINAVTRVLNVACVLLRVRGLLLSQTCFPSFLWNCRSVVLSLLPISR